MSFEKLGMSEFTCGNCGAELDETDIDEDPQDAQCPECGSDDIEAS